MPAWPFLIDSNILLRWVQPHNPDFPIVEAALALLAGRGSDLFYASQNLGEFWNTCTRPIERNGFGLTPEQADQRAKFFEHKLQLLPDAPALHELWRELLVRYKVSGVQVHDAKLAAIMQVHGIRRILTFNTKDFSRYREITAIHPKEVK